MSNRRNSLRPNSRSRNTRRTRQPGFGERVRNAHSVARDQKNHRGNNRRTTMTRQSAIADSSDFIDDSEHLNLPAIKHLLSWIMGLLLVPLCFVTVITLFQRVGDENYLATFWRSPEFFHFTIGVCLMIAWFMIGIANNIFLLIYVLGHEMTHALFVYLCGGRVSRLYFTTEGGYILTNKSNILIALSPYFVPFWSVVAISIHNVVSSFYPTPYNEQILIILLGGTWCFHVIWTAWMIPKDQPDLKEYGTFFSLMIIILANLVLLSLLVCGASEVLDFKTFAWNWWNNVLDLSEALFRSLTNFW